MRLKIGMGDSPNFSAKVNLKSRFSEVDLRIAAKGEEYNPIVELTEQEDADDNFYRLIILKAYRDHMTYVRKNGENIVNIKVHEPSSSRKRMVYTLVGMVLGGVCGLAMQFGLDAATLTAINTELINPVR